MQSQWPDKCFRRFIVGHHLPDADQKNLEGILSKASPKDFVARLKKAHVQSFMFYVKCHYGNAYYNNSVGHKHSALGQRDLFKEYVEACLAHDIAPIACYELADHRIIKEKPEWCHRIPQVDPDQKVDWTDAQQHTQVGGVCFNSPYGDFALQQTLEVVRQYPIAGYLMDMVDFAGLERWVCPYCNALFRQEFGHDFQGTEGMSREEYARYIQWRYRQVTNYTERVRNAIKQENSAVTFVINFHGHTSATSSNYWLDIARANDYLSSDIFSLREGYLALSWKVRAQRRYSFQAPGEVLFDAMTCVAGDFLTPKPLDQYLAENWTAYANGVTNMISIIMNHDGTLDERIFRLTDEINRDLQTHEQWLEGWRPIYDILLVRGQDTVDFRRWPDFDFHTMDFEGWCQVLIEKHFLWDVIVDRDLSAETMQGCKVLILPNCVCLGPKSLEAIRQFVAGGGTVIATAETSLAEQDGKIRKNFGLAEVFGVDYHGPLKDANRQLKVDLTELQPDRDWEPDIAVFTEGQLDVKARSGTEVWGRVFARPSGLFNVLLDSQQPGLVCNRLGQGRAIYFAGMPGAQYRRYGLYVIKNIMDRLLRHVLGSDRMVEVTAAPTVEVTAGWQTAQNRLVIHLINLVSNTARSAPFIEHGNNVQGEPDEMLPAVDNVVRIRLPQARKPKAVYLAPDRQALKYKQKGTVITVEIEQVKTHAALVVEM